MDLKLSNKQLVTVVAVVIVAVASLVVVWDFNGKSLDLTDREVRIIPTDSMDGADQPYDIKTIPQWSLVMIKKIDSQEEVDSLKVGDVILFYNTVNHLDTVHRIIDITESGGHITKVTTHGDNKTPGIDETVNASDIHGIVVGVSPWMGQFVHFVQSSTILMILIIVVIFVMVSAVWDIIKIRRNEEQ